MDVHRAVIKGKNAGRDLEENTWEQGTEINPATNSGKEPRTFCSDFSSFLQRAQLWVGREENGHFFT